MSYVIQTGNWVGAQWSGPRWTPFAQALADHYPVQVPWFWNTQIDFTTTPQRRTVRTTPQEYDVLIIGAHVQGNASQLPFVFLQVTHQESGVPWAVPNILPFFPITAFGGVNVNNMPNLRMPEAFFLPKNTQLKLDWSMLGLPSFVNPDPFRLTLLGVQLSGAEAPERVEMPNGKLVRTDERLPLFMTMGLGFRQAGGNFQLNNNQQRIQFLPPIDCDVEI